MSLHNTTGVYADPQALNDLTSFIVMLQVAMKDSEFQRPRISMDSGEDSWIGLFAKYKQREFAAGVYSKYPKTLYLELQDESLDYPTKEFDLEGILSKSQSPDQKLERLKKFLRDNAERLLGENRNSRRH